MNVVRGLRPLDESEGGAVRGGVLTAGEMALLAAVQDRLIPREGALPGAGESGAAARVDGFLVERRDWRVEVLAALKAVEVAAGKVGELRPMGANEARGGFLDLTADEKDAVLQGVEAAEPRLFARLVRVTYTAYYTDPGVRRAGGFEVEAPQPGGYGLERFDPARLEGVRRRGRLWREA